MGLNVDNLSAAADSYLLEALAEGERIAWRDDVIRGIRGELGKDGSAKINALENAWERTPHSLRDLILEELLSRAEVFFAVEPFADNSPPDRANAAFGTFDISSVIEAVRKQLILGPRKADEVETCLAYAAVHLWKEAKGEVLVGKSEAPTQLGLFVRDVFLKYLAGNYADKAIFRTPDIKKFEALQNAVAALERLVKLGLLAKRKRSGKRSLD